MRFRSTAFAAIRLLTVKPKRGGPSSPRSRACSRKALRATLLALAAARKSVRRFRRSTAPRSLGRQPLAPLGAPPRQNLPAVACGHARAETVAALAHKPARLIGPFHRVCRLAAVLGLADAAASRADPTNCIYIRDNAGTPIEPAPGTRPRYRVKDPPKSTPRPRSRAGDATGRQLQKTVTPHTSPAFFVR